jgi:diaminopimelate epimerase
MILFHYSGAGNEFLLSDNRSDKFPVETVPCLCDRKKVDGVILLENAHNLALWLTSKGQNTDAKQKTIKSGQGTENTNEKAKTQTQIADAFMRIYNRDGSEAEMCGNGLRCFVHFLQRMGIQKKNYIIQTQSGMHEAWQDDQEVCIKLSPPSELKLHLEKNLHFINTGVPHAVVFAEKILKLDVVELGRFYRFSPMFAPSGANVNFVACQADGSLSVRTYERGVESETAACGTGAIASALIAHKLHNLPSPIVIHVQSGDHLTVTFNHDWSVVTLKGKVSFLGIENSNTNFH